MYFLIYVYVFVNHGFLAFLGELLPRVGECVGKKRIAAAGGEGGLAGIIKQTY